MDFANGTITITFGDVAENHIHNQQIGQLADCGFTIEDLEAAKLRFEEAGCACELVSLNQNIGIPTEPASVLVIRGAVNKFLENSNANSTNLFVQLRDLDWDTKALMYGRVVNKHARSNLCFNDEAQEPNYAQGMGRIIPYNSVNLLKIVRDSLAGYIGDKAVDLKAEGNYYRDVTVNGISYHSDLERSKVVAIRLGTSIPIYFNWFYKSEPKGQRMSIDLHHGDMYIMSEKAVGTDGRKKTIPILRHSTGAAKYTNL
jgi:alkylated DNA repair dioxygenase AlkB